MQRRCAHRDADAANRPETHEVETVALHLAGRDARIGRMPPGFRRERFTGRDGMILGESGFIFNLVRRT